MRLIDADILKQQIAVWQRIDPYNTLSMAAGAFSSEVDKSPTVDAVPVVRCEDCPRWDAATQYRSGYCKKLRYCTPPDFYCKYGSEEQS